MSWGIPALDGWDEWMYLAEACADGDLDAEEVCQYNPESAVWFRRAVDDARAAHVNAVATTSEDIVWRGSLVGFQTNVRNVIKRLHDSTCEYCGRRGSWRKGPDGNPWNIDHRTPLSVGGSQRVENLALACRTCNYSKGPRTEEEYREALVVKAGGAA
jgi:5-methylcytosine-specific restriction endonuclease McrA